jgi:DNA-binding transcriptional regulator YiaG
MKTMVKEQESTIIIDTSKEMTMKEYAKYLNIPYTTVATWVQRKQISFRRIAELNDLILVHVGTEKKY